MNKNILHLTVADPEGTDIEWLARSVEDATGCFVIVSLAKHNSAKLLSAKRMKRSDYTACINAAKAILNDKR